MTALFLVGDVRDRMAELEGGTFDFILCSPPFLALRSYLPEDHPDKAKEIGSEPTPAAFLDVLLELTAEWGRLLAPHGSIAIELGDTYAGSGGAGGDYDGDGLRDGQQRFNGAAAAARAHVVKERTRNPGPGWPLDKSLACIPQLYQVALAYGINPLTGQSSPAGRWRVRNLKPWIRSNPPVGALGDKERPATSYVVVACRARDRWFDLDAVRTRPTQDPATYTGNGYTKGRPEGVDGNESMPGNAAGAPPRDWWHHIDAILDTELAARANGAPHHATPPKKHPKVTGDYDAPNPGAQGVHLRRALERAGILTTLDALDVSPRGYSGMTRPTTRLVPCGPHDGGLRTTSRGCPVHGDRLAQPRTAPGDGRADDPETRTPHTDGRHAPARPDGFAATDHPSELQTAQSNSGSPLQQCAPAASPRGNESSRTGPAPSTNSADTPSAGTTGRTARTSASPSLTELHPDTPESSTSAACPDGDTPETSARSADTSFAPSDAACTCSYHLAVRDEEATSHYAVWPPELVRLLVDEMCPRRVCLTCGQPSRRITGEVEYVQSSNPTTSRSKAWADAPAAKWESGIAQGKGAHSRKPDGGRVRFAPTLGWTDCGCEHCTCDGHDHRGAVTRCKFCPCDLADHWRPGRILDPFVGSGTTLAVASGMGRDATGIDIDERNALLARERVGMFLDVVPPGWEVPA